MNEQLYDINIENYYQLPTPAEVHEELPLMHDDADKVYQFRQNVKNIIHRRDKRILVIAGPCSIDHIPSARIYAERFAVLRREMADKMELVMRAYFEKPRSVLGWKGFVYDPDLNNSFRMERGLRESRKFLLELVKMDLPAATEFLDPTIPQYLSDLISWAAIGARTVESQTHRQLASGLSMPVGFKNATDGAISAAVEAVMAARSKHSFLGVTNSGHPGVYSTKGNPDGHIVLRGGPNCPNFGSENVAYAVELMRKKKLEPSLIVDCSHGNSRKNPALQLEVLRDIASQIKGGQSAISGVMLESYLMTGNQPISERKEETLGLSVTDGCLGWEETEKALRELYNTLP